MEEKPNYYAIIPADVRYDKDLKDKAKLLYGEIVALSNKDGYCYASNKYFAELYSVSTRTITALIRSLIDKEYLSSELTYKKNTKEVLQRKLYLSKKSSIPIEKNFYTPIEENFQDNNTSINNTSINIKEKSIKRKIFTKPKIEEIQQYCIERNNGINAEAFYDFYESKNWYVGKNKMSDWKACVRTWERRNPKPKERLPEWFDKKTELEAATNEEQEEIENLLKEFK